MSSHENKVTIDLEDVESKATIKIEGPLSDYIEGLARYVNQAYRIKAELSDDTSTIAVTWSRTPEDNDPMSGAGDFSYVECIKLGCRQWLLDVTGRPVEVDDVKIVSNRRVIAGYNY